MCRKGRLTLLRFLSSGGLVAVLVMTSACGTQPSGDAERIAPLDTLPFTMSFSMAREPAVELETDRAAERARQVRSTVDVSAAAGLSLDVWATEDLVQDPVALDVDEDGSVYVTVSSRAGGLLDIRNHPTWRHDALAMQDVYEHEAHLRRVLAPERSDENDWLPDHNGDGSRDWRDLMVNTERLYRLTDRDGDGVADRSEKLVEGFNTPVSDVLGGLLLHDGDIYLSSAPGLYRLVDGTTDPKPEVSTVSWGYNVHPGFNGHGMSGVTVGPDGRIYWGVGDMGFSVTAPDGSHHHYPNQGAVLRSFPDGSGFEVFATGLRNTHEFDFDDRGNLISVDNDGDHPGEMERIVYIVDGSDSGWRVNWQFGKYGEDRNNDYKVWMDEELFKPHFDGQAAYITPPISNYHSGPAGFAYNPGTALGEEWSGHFFMSEYTGSPATTNVHAFRLDEQGAGFTLAEERVAVSGVLTVGIGFGPDGALYLADWIDGWVSKGSGRIWRLDASDSPGEDRARTRELLNANYDAASTAELFDRLNYDDLRVRRKAQFELAARGDEETLLRAAREGASLHARLHGLWGLWQRALLDAATAESFVEFLGDEEAEVRAQAAKILGDVRYAPAAESLVPRLADTSARVRFFAAQALGRIEHRPAFEAVVAMLAENDGRDVYLRHAGALALARIGDAGALVALADHASEAVRVAAVVALRRMRHEGAAAFLDDASAHVVTEAARAINDDGGIDAAIPDLAALLGATPHSGEALERRVIGANLREGTPAAAQRLAEFAVETRHDDAMRAEAVAVLGVWPEPSVLDRVDGIYLGEAEMDTSAARTAAAPAMEALLADASSTVREEAAVTAMRLRIDDAVPHLIDRLATDISADVRLAALEALVVLGTSDDEDVLRLALDDPEEGVRRTAVRLVSEADLDDEVVAEILASAIAGESIEEAQSALAVLSEMQSEQARAVIADQMSRLENVEAARELELDILMAAEASGSQTLAERAEAFRASRPPYRAALYGGNPERGRSLFYNHDGAQCTRCHGGAAEGENVGPDLDTIGARLGREQLLEALVDPAARIAPGYGTPGGPSAMPSMAQILAEDELRDLVAYLAAMD